MSEEISINPDETASMATNDQNEIESSKHQDDDQTASQNETNRNDDPKPEKIIEQNMNELFSTLQPFILKLDEQIMAVKQSQQLLNDELSCLLSILDQIKSNSSSNDNNQNDDDDRKKSNNDNQSVFIYPKRMFQSGGNDGGNIGDGDDLSIDIETKSRRLLGLKRRLTLINSILQTVNSRVKKLLLSYDSRILRHQQQQQLSTTNVAN
ncbi:uncharacterized protein LOC113797048 [Dermatophagoides pteronyssinus]|uniref:uncharacterized protein LOC113797048 n=1 Tax=Dermatophagoides pteronyssinus TaxID=6956 RepID=UPI003F671629